MKTILSVQDLSCVGKCSLSVAMPVISAMGLTCACLPTGVLSTHTAFPNPHKRDLTEDILPTLRHWQEIGAAFDAISIGYLASNSQVALSEKLIDTFDSFVVLDPAMADHGKLYGLIEADRPKVLRSLCQKANVLLPNVTEAALLTDIPYTKNIDLAYCRKLAEGLKKLGCDTFVITGISLAADTIGFFAMDKGEEFSYQGAKIPSRAHGTGDLFTAVFTGSMVKGKSAFDAAVTAANFVERCLIATPEYTPFGVAFEPLLSTLWQEA